MQSISCVQRILSRVIGPILVSSIGSPAFPQDCPKGDPFSTTYLYRLKMERCEGTRNWPIRAPGFSLAALQVGRFTEFKQRLRLQTPRLTGRPEPEVVVNALKGNYQMRPRHLHPQKDTYRFDWGIGVIRNAGIPLPALRAKARLLGAPTIYLPVLLSKDQEYSFVLYSSQPISLEKLFILTPEGRAIKTFQVSEFSGEYTLTWDARTQPAGLYRLVAQPLRPSAPGLNLTFLHDPRWLR